MYRILIVLLSVYGLVACSSSPQTHYYLLQHHDLDRLSDYDELGARIVVGQIDVAPFLAGQGLVTVARDNQVHQAYYHRWAEPLNSQLQRQLRTNLQQQLPNVDWLSLHGSAHLRSLDYRIDLVMDQFHLDIDNEVLVGGQWQLRSHEQGYVAHGQFQQREPLHLDGYAAMVSSLEQAWLRASAEIARDIARALSAQ